MRRGAGFTLLETLAAVITLGLLASAAVPLLRHLGRLDVAERMQAQSHLKTLAPRIDPAAGMIQAVPGRPDWSLLISDLVAEPEPAPPPGFPPPAGPAHRWLLVALQANDGGETLAETLVAVVDRGAQP